MKSILLCLVLCIYSIQLNAQAKLNDDSYKTTLESKEAGLSVTNFYAVWNKFGKLQNELFEEIAESYPNVNFYSIDAEKSPKAARDFRIRGYPTLIFHKNGEKVSQEMGYRNREQLIALIKTFTDK